MNELLKEYQRTFSHQVNDIIELDRMVNNFIDKPLATNKIPVKLREINAMRAIIQSRSNLLRSIDERIYNSIHRKIQKELTLNHK